MIPNPPAWLQKTVALHRRYLEWIFLCLEFAVLLVWFWGGWQLQLQTPVSFLLYELGVKAGEVALVLYLATLLPGIFQRMKWLPLWVALVMPFRRHVGILMFLMACMHYSFVVLLPIVFGVVAPVVTATTSLGLLALLSLLPLWLTSNDVSKKTLGKWWKRLHRLTYLALLLLFGHVAVQISKWSLPMVLVLVLEIWSWTVVRKKVHTKPTSEPKVALQQSKIS